MFGVYWLSVSYAFLILCMIYKEEELTIKNKLAHIKYYFLGILMVTLIPMLIVYFLNPAWLFVVFLFVPPLFFAKFIYSITEDGWSAWKQISKIYKLSFQNWIAHMSAFSLAALLHVILFYIIHSSLGNLIFDFFYWHELFDGLYVTRVIILTIAYSIVHIIMAPLYFYISLNFSYSEEAKINATDLWNRFDNFNQQSSIFEAKV